MDVAFFRTHVLTKGLKHEELERLQGLLDEVTFREGDALLTEGAVPKGLFIVVEGDVRVLKIDPSDAERELAKLSGPTVLGELELVSGEPAMATARATSPVRAFELSAEAFERLVNDGDPLAARITRNIARVAIRRLAETNTRMVALFALANT